jgi:hypothetical protein
MEKAKETRLSKNGDNIVYLILTSHTTFISTLHGGG